MTVSVSVEGEPTPLPSQVYVPVQDGLAELPTVPEVGVKLQIQPPEPVVPDAEAQLLVLEGQT